MTPEPHSPPPEDLAARVLNALRSTEPAPGFQDRLLLSLAAAQATSARPPLFARPLRWLPAWTMLTLATLGVFVIAHRVSSRPTAATRPAGTLAHSSNSPSVSREDLSQATPQAGRAERTRAPKPGRSFPHRDSDDVQTVAAVEAAAPSHPPPPLPITSEERQIQRFASRHTAFDLAALAPAAESAHDAADRRAFHDFFSPDPAVTVSSASEAPPAAPAP